VVGLYGILEIPDGRPDDGRRLHRASRLRRRDAPTVSDPVSGKEGETSSGIETPCMVGFVQHSS
jgi:hypothetical protein